MRRLLVLGFVWGWSFLFIKVAVQGMTPTAVAWARIALGASVLLVVLRRRGVALPTDRTMLRRFALVTLAGNIVPFTLLATAEQHITSALTAVLNASTPLFTALLSAVALGERLRPVQVAGLALGAAGVAVAAGVGAADVQGSSLAGALAAIGAGAGYGVAFVYMRRHLVTVAPIVAATGQLLAGSVLLFPVALGTSLARGVDLTPTRVVAVVLLGAVGTGMAFALNYRMVADIGATRASLVTYVVPVVAVIVGVVVLDEPFGWRLVVGGLLTAAGITLVGRRRAAAPAPAASEASV